MLLSWDMKLRDFQTLLIQDGSYQGYCRALREKKLLKFAAIDTAFGLLLGGPNKKTDNQRVKQATEIYLEIIAPGLNWQANMNQLIKTEKWGDASEVLAQQNDKTIWEVFSALKAGKLEKMTLKDKRQESVLYQALSLLLKGTPEQQIVDLIYNNGCRQIIFTGAPGTGKTFTARKIAAEACGLDYKTGKKDPTKTVWGGMLTNDATQKPEPYTLVQFHPSYDYTDFVEGLRPIDRKKNTTADKQTEDSSSSGILFAKVDGCFKSFCRKVVAANKETNPAAPDDVQFPLYFFIIDEINRANLSKVFGELMFGLEKDKRGERGKVQTQYQNLRTYDFEKNDSGDYLTTEEDCFAQGFYIPKNVVILGTMNDIDRSVDSMDFALRRRFEWREFLVEKETLVSAFMARPDGDPVKENASELASHIMNLNEYLREKGTPYGLNRQYYISQGQFSNLPERLTTLDDILQYAWEYRIESLLREYLRGTDEQDIETFIGQPPAGNKAQKNPMEHAWAALMSRIPAADKEKAAVTTEK